MPDSVEMPAPVKTTTVSAEATISARISSAFRVVLDDVRHGLDPFTPAEVTLMRYLHTMVRVRNLDESLRFWSELVGLVVRSDDYPQGRFTLVYLAAPADVAAAKA